MSEKYREPYFMVLERSNSGDYYCVAGGPVLEAVQPVARDKAEDNPGVLYTVVRVIEQVELKTYPDIVYFRKEPKQ